MRRKCNLCGQMRAEKRQLQSLYIEEWPRNNDLPELPCI